MRGLRSTATLLAVALVAGACGDDDDGDGTPDDEVEAAEEESTDDPGNGVEQMTAGCDLEESGEALEGEQTLDLEGEERTYSLQLPDDYDGTTPQPLLLSFHGWSVDKDAHESTTRMGEQGVARGYVVATPEGLGDPLEWNIFEEEEVPDNYTFINTLVDELGQQLCLDPARIFAAGHSEGSAFTGFLACREPYHFAAVAMVAAFIPPTCPAEDAAPSIVAFHGMADPLVPYEGGDYGGPVPIPAALGTFEDYVEHHGCEEPTSDEPASDVERLAADECETGGNVALYSIEEGGHEWPDEDVVATDVILDFFDGQDIDA